MSSEIDSKNFLNVLKKIPSQKERNNQFKQYEDYIVKQALSLMKSNGSINNNYGKNNKSHSNDIYNENSSSSSNSKLDKQNILGNSITSLKELIGIENGYCWTTYLISWSLNCIKRITGSNSNNDISFLISRNIKYPLINPLISLLSECLIVEPEDQGPGYTNMIMDFFFTYIFDHGNNSKNSVHWVVYHIVKLYPENLLPKIHNYVILSCQNSGFIALSNVIFSQSGSDKIFTFVKSVIDYCNNKCPLQVVDSFVELIDIYNNAIQLNSSQLNSSQLMDWKQYILSYLFTFIVSTPQIVKGIVKNTFKKFGSNTIIKMIVYEYLSKFSKIISTNRAVDPFTNVIEIILLKIFNNDSINFPINKFLYLWFTSFEDLYNASISLTNEFMINENEFYQIKVTIQRKLNELLILLLNTIHNSIILQNNSTSIMSSFRTHVIDLSELLVKRVNESFSENSNIEIILRMLELCATNFGEVSAIKILSHAIKYLSYESPQLESSNVLEEGEELESESDVNYLSYIKIIWKLKIAFELKCPNVLSNCIKNIFEELPNMSDDEIKSLFQKFNLLLEVNDYLPKDHQENSKNIFSNSNQWKQIYQYINHNNVEIVIQSYKLLSKCLPNHILPCEKFQICTTLTTNYFNYLRKRIIYNLPNNSVIKPKNTITNNELIQMFSSIKNCLIRLLENSNYIGPTLDILFQEIFCKVDINPLNESLDIQKMKAYLDEFDDIKKVKKKENYGYSLYEANLLICEQQKTQQENNMTKSTNTVKRILAPSNLTESKKISVYPLDVKKRPGEQLSVLGLNKKINTNKNSLYDENLEKAKKEAQKLNIMIKQSIKESVKWNKFDVCSLITLCFKLSTTINDRKNRNTVFFTKQFVKSLAFIPSSIQQYDDNIPKATLYFDRDIQLNRTVNKNPFIWDILEIIYEDPTLNNYIYDVVKSLLASSIWFWNSPIRQKPNDFLDELNNTKKLMNILRNSQWIPAPLGLSGMIFNEIQGKDICSILMKVWDLLKKSQPNIPPNLKTPTIIEEESYKSSEIVRQILRRDIHKFKNYFPIFYRTNYSSFSSKK
ncbi:hypothetical protein BCR32DRAFT_291088 [Anaeromyces robustus]|uniref:Integrator complex subunit 5 C-terminal domain-containing protein n=1 Tax=Anaeromyces robustus TaxID=1754192 RepID=A0A1Y1XGD8_9FUNG|nr:hypothetical protein BCR32DRAFT_291088 [Anaeromyces robustus]|eukprot:ORX84829.1 hypothetical protein BCR32DRAFT_291088 [Anaeromyces robustus]